MKISENAILFLQNLQKKHDGKVLCLSIKKTGCSGYQYDLKWENKESFILINDIKMHIDSNWTDFFQKVNIDLEIDNLKQKNIKLNHPETKSLCGCGESFDYEG